ncbi:MAG: DUF6319 family protein [Mycobacteriaceae bacterium]
MPPPPKPVAASLSEDELTCLRTALEEGKRPTVYLRDAVPSLGVDAASSARVVSVEGSTVTVRPKGVGDDVPFDAGELYSTKAAATHAATAVAGTRTARVAASGPAPRLPVPVRPAAARELRAPRAPAAREASEVPKATARRAKTAARRATTAQRISVTISGTADGGWTVQCTQGVRKLGDPAPVTADAVVRAVAALGDEAVSTAVSEVLDAARRAAAERVAELRAELELAQTALQAFNQGSH